MILLRLVALSLSFFIKIKSCYSRPSQKSFHDFMPRSSNVNNNARITRGTFFRKKIIASTDLRKQWNLRGGDSHTPKGEKDEERYSRQIYTLGARAHNLVRASTIFVDGPSRSGLLYESVKNLALSGVGQIVLLTINGVNAQTHDVSYHDFDYDDLGYAYLNCAREECPLNSESSKATREDDDARLVAEYIRRLNPNVRVQVMKRSDFLSRLCIEKGEENVLPEGGEEAQHHFEQILGINPVLLCIDRPQSTQVSLNAACRSFQKNSKKDQTSNGIPFVSIETCGLFGRVFCDFGNQFHIFDEDGEAPKCTLLDSVLKQEDQKNTDEFVVNCVEGEKHDVSKGDKIIFQWKNGVDEGCGRQCTVVYVKNPTSFTVKLNGEREINSREDNSLSRYLAQLNESGNSFMRVKIPKVITFMPLDEAIQEQNNSTNEIFAPSDLDKSFDFTRRSAVMASFDALDKFVQQKNRLPSTNENTNEEDDLNTFLKLTKVSQKDHDIEFDAIVRSFVVCAKAKFTPLQALYGALGSQETLKAATGLYNPVKQFLLYDCDEVYTAARLKKKSDTKFKRGIAGISYILGKKLVKRIASKKIFVVGSGAIGCEILKNLSAMGAGTSPEKGGRVILTDLDTIEKSNLSRQLLFRDSDVGKFKSIAALEAVQKFNPLVNIDAHTSKVGDNGDEYGTFDDKFWSTGVDVVLNALDNVEARLFIDSVCVSNHKPMIDAGTLGAKGNVQVVVPNQSESYGSSVDPPEPAIPVCTLKNFPYEISHTIQWAKDLFDGLFVRRPRQVNESMEAVSKSSTLEFSQSLHKLGKDVAKDVVDELLEDLVDFDYEKNDYIKRLRITSIQWAAYLAKKMFFTSIKDLLSQHPEDSFEEDGKPFWSGTRRAPKTLIYSESSSSVAEQELVNSSMLDFVRYASRLRIEAYFDESILQGDETVTQYSHVSVQEAKEMLQVLKFKERDVPEDGNHQDSLSSVESISKKIDILNTISKKFKRKLNVASFEKDDDLNGHVAFIAAASNLRALCYDISPVDAIETRRIAGRIIPAMITTTAFVSALSCLELVKLLQGMPLKSHRNAFVNLALPFFAFTSPLPAEKSPGLNGEMYTIWDKIIIKEGQKTSSKAGITLGMLINKIERKSSAKVSSVSYGPYLLYATFLNAGDDSIFRRPLLQLIKEAIISEDEDIGDFYEDVQREQPIREQTLDSLTEDQRQEIKKAEKRLFIDLDVLVEDSESYEDIELPPVRVVRWMNQ